MCALSLWRMLEGEVIKNQYHLQELLGSGTFAGVFRTDDVFRDKVLRSLATKVITLNDPRLIDRQLEKLQVGLSLDHPNLLRCYGAGEETLQENSWL